MLIVMIQGATAADCVPAIGAVSIQGETQVQASGTGAWRPAALDEQLCPGDLIRVGSRSRVQVSILNQPNVRIDQNTALHLPRQDQPWLFRLLYGTAYFLSRHPRVLTVDTPFVDAAVEGTEFLVRVEADRTLILVFEGRIVARNDQGELAIASGQAAVAEAGQAPSPYLVARPREAVQWAWCELVEPRPRRAAAGDDVEVGHAQAGLHRADVDILQELRLQQLADAGDLVARLCRVDVGEKAVRPGVGRVEAERPGRLVDAELPAKE